MHCPRSAGGAWPSIVGFYRTGCRSFLRDISEERPARWGGERPVGTSPERTSSITVGWSTNVQPGTTVEVSLRRKGETGEFPAPVARVPAEQGTARITGLKAGSV